MYDAHSEMRLYRLRPHVGRHLASRTFAARWALRAQSRAVARVPFRIRADPLSHADRGALAAASRRRAEHRRARIARAADQGRAESDRRSSSASTTPTRIKALEAKTNHDVKAVEYYLQQKLDGVAVQPATSRRSFISRCTSEDINNLSYALMLRDARQRVLLPAMRRARASTCASSRIGSPTCRCWRARTASPRRRRRSARRSRTSSIACSGRRELFAAVDIHGKFNGAVGNHNAHVAAYPNADWIAITDRFIASLGVDARRATRRRSSRTTGSPSTARRCRGSTPCSIDLCRDFWGYISLGYFRSRPVAGEVGSSTMPHKVNPIDFENAEGNLGVANELLGIPRDEAAGLALAARPHRLHGAAQRRRRARPHADRARGGWQRARQARRGPRHDRRRPREPLGSAGRGDTDRHAPLRLARRLRAAQGAHARSCHRRRRLCANSSARCRSRPPSASGCSRSTPPLIRASPRSSRAASRPRRRAARRQNRDRGHSRALSVK